jgi:hypothetical protein
MVCQHDLHLHVFALRKRESVRWFLKISPTSIFIYWAEVVHEIRILTSWSGLTIVLSIVSLASKS